ncbi:MAG: hypothetical protein K2K57_05185 [Oscillospiraceae bacterium]|nr:hypothetical protein [Oscillospiraceae bacterium]
MKTAKKAAIILSAAVSAMAALSAVTALSTGASAEWVETEEGFCYTDNYTDERLTGWQTIGNGEYYYDGKWHALGKRKYYFDKNGVALTGWQEIDGNTYFFNGEKKGRMVTSWVNSANGRYYFGEDGVMRRGWKLIGEDVYFFGDDGIASTGEQTIGGDVYTFDGEGRLIDPAPGKITLNDILQGISFGMTKAEARTNSILDLNERREDSFVFTSVLSEDECCMLFDEDGRLTKIELYYPYSDIEALFADSEWKFEDDLFIEYPHAVDSEELYLSEDGSAGAIVDYCYYGFYYGDWTKIYIEIYSRDEAEDIWQRHKYY